jgi:hypothetical protein
VTSEAGGSASFSVKLNSPPTANVSVAVSSSDTTEGVPSASSLTFTPQNWNTPQVVTVTGVDDSVRDGDIGYTIVLGAATSADPAYNALNPSDVSATNRDNEKGKINANTLSLATSSLAFAETVSEPAPDDTISETKEGGGAKDAPARVGRSGKSAATSSTKSVDEAFAEWDDPLAEDALDALVAG